MYTNNIFCTHKNQKTRKPLILLGFLDLFLYTQKFTSYVLHTYPSFFAVFTSFFANYFCTHKNQKSTKNDFCTHINHA